MLTEETGEREAERQREKERERAFWVGRNKKKKWQKDRQQEILRNINKSRIL